MFAVGIFLLAALCVIAYVMWEVRLVYKLTLAEVMGVGVATLIVILFCVLLFAKSCAHAASPL